MSPGRPIARRRRSAPSPEYGSATAVLLADLAAHIRMRVILTDPRHADVVALWILHTHVFSRWYTTGYLYPTSEIPGAGKSTFGEIIRDLSFDAVKTNVPTLAAITRTLDEDKPKTLIIDEVQAILKSRRIDQGHLAALLDSGSTRGEAITIADLSDPNGVITRKLFSPKVIIGRESGLLPPSTMTRTIVIPMRPETVDELRQRQSALPRRPEIRRMVEDLRARIDAWAAEYAEKIDGEEPRIIALDDAEQRILNGRTSDTWRPLFALADLAGNGWPTKLRAIAADMIDDDDRQDHNQTAAFDNLLRAAMQARKIRTASYLGPKLAPLPADQVGNVTNDDLNYRRQGTRGVLISLVIDLETRQAAFRIAANQWSAFASAVGAGEPRALKRTLSEAGRLKRNGRHYDYPGALFKPAEPDRPRGRRRATPEPETTAAKVGRVVIIDATSWFFPED